jgi:hypothetical protein
LIECEVTFRRGDANADGEVDMSDAVHILQFLFGDSPFPTCPDAADVQDSGELDISDAVATLNHLFIGAIPPAAPGPRACGVDPTSDMLGPCDYRACD